MINKMSIIIKLIFALIIFQGCDDEWIFNIPGCTDSNALNYDSYATSDNGKIVKVSTLGKVKTIIQMAGISLVIGSPLIKGFFYFEHSLK